MFQFIEPAARQLAAATFVSAILVAGPLHAATNEAPQLAQAVTAPSVGTQPSADQSAPAKRGRGQNIEARIKSLHDQLKITQAQEPQWNQVAQVMREGAKTMRDINQKRRANAKTMSAIDDLHSYQDVASAHAQELQKLIPVFQTLYDSMSPEQKRNADAIFQRHQRRQRQSGGRSQ
jgi:periplasmic protein CpxP/Spy